jgi:hypothetical protein
VGACTLAPVGISDKARIALGCIRLLNGGLALVAPGFLARQIGVDPDANPGVLYVFRMFGIRTVLVGAELLTERGERRSEALQRAVLIHASDTLAAVVATLSRTFPKRGRAIVAISAVNTALAMIANR